SLTHTPSLSHTHTHSLSLSHSHTHTHTHTHHTHSPYLSLSLSLTHIHTLSLSHTHTLSLTHTHLRKLLAHSSSHMQDEPHASKAGTLKTPVCFCSTLHVPSELRPLILLGNRALLPNTTTTSPQLDI